MLASWWRDTPTPASSSPTRWAGGGQLQVDGKPALPVQPGVAFQVPMATPHSFQKCDKATKLAATFVVEKGKRLASPA